MSLSMIEFLLQETWQSIRRNGLMSLATTSNMTVSLLILSAFFLTTLNLQSMAAAEAHKANITVELKDGAQAAPIEAKLLADARVAETTYVPADQALEDLAEAYGMDLEALQALENPLPNAIIVKPRDPQDMAAVAQLAKNLEGVAAVRYREQITDKLLTLARGIRTAGLVTALLMGVATLVIVSTTIRLTIYARRREIRIMQLVGATNAFIRLPFILEGAFHGVVGGAVSTVLVLAAYSWTNSYVSQHLGFLDLVYSTKFAVLYGLGTLLCGIAFGVVGSLIGLNRYLRQI